MTAYFTNCEELEVSKDLMILDIYAIVTNSEQKLVIIKVSNKICESNQLFDLSYIEF